MARLPFNPERIPEPEAPAPARREQARYGSFESAQPMNVTQVCELIKRIVADRAPSPIRVVGEVSNFSERGHWYLSLKDDASILHCVVWATAAKKCLFTPERGQQVVATGRLDYYGPQGKLQLYVDSLEPVGQGALELKYRQMCDQLRELGYFAEERKKPMPAFPEHLAIITSANGAALHDVIRTARHRWRGVRLSLVDVKVQGEGAAEQVARAVTILGQQHKRLGIDAIILTRGGGSLEDLWAFNERVVADAVFNCEAPIAVGVGHETDTTIAELIADLRCSTPTQAAARLVPDAETEQHRAHQLVHRLTASLRRAIERLRGRLDALAVHPVFRRPADRLVRLRGELDHAERRLRAAAQQHVTHLRHALADQQHVLATIEPRARLNLAHHQLRSAERSLTASIWARVQNVKQRLDAAARQLQSVGPENVLRRGFSYTTDASGALIRSADQIAAGDAIITNLADGKIESQVVKPGASAPPKPAPLPSPTPRKSRRPASPLGGLFDTP
jgi:exodeoxyribonuclease VII large subunit